LVVVLLVEEKDSVSQQIWAVAQGRLQAREEGATVTYKRSAAEVFEHSTPTPRFHGRVYEHIGSEILLAIKSLTPDKI
jgi:hypothetical protein